MFKRILVPFDDSEGSARALDLAAALARRHGGAVRLVHHFDVQAYPDPGGYGEPVFRTAHEAAQRMLEGAQSRLAARGVDANVMLCRVMGGRLGRCIADDAEGCAPTSWCWAAMAARVLRARFWEAGPSRSCAR